MIVAVDGPAASGKGTIGRLLAVHFDLHYLDTGLLYRAVASALLHDHDPMDDENAAVLVAGRLSLDHLDEDVLASRQIGDAASEVAVLPRLREALTSRQRVFARQLGGAVLVGRDIGTIVCPDADAKIFLTASPAMRAARRAEQLGIEGQAGRLSVLEELETRDRRDFDRVVAPLRRAADARLLDTTELDIETTFRAAVEIVERAAGKID